MLLWLTVTIEAPPHAERLVLEHNLHVVDPTVTRHAADTALNVCSVVKVYVVWKVVDANPLDRFSTFPACANRRELIALGVQL